MALLAESRCLAGEKKFDAAVALAAFVARHPIVWKETRDLATALLGELSGNLDQDAFQAASLRLEGCNVRALTASWMADYSAG
jgi:hypothetical protein